MSFPADADALLASCHGSLCSPLLNRIPHPPPERSVTSIKIKPNSHRLTHQILLRNEAGRLAIVLEAAVLAVIAIVAHEEVFLGRNHPFARLGPARGEHDAVAFGVQLFECRRSPHIV